MRVFAACCLIAAASIVAAPNSQELRERYGKPKSERFTARPAVDVSVDYGEDGLACQAVIAPPSFQDDAGKLMPSDSVSQVIEEIAPLAARGNEISSGSFQSGCNAANFSDYENLSIRRTVHTCDASSRDQDVSTLIVFKRDICPKHASPIITSK